MEEFFQKEQPQEDQFFGQTVSTPSVPESLTEVLSDYYSTALDKPREEVIRDLQSNFYPMLREEASRKADATSEASFSNAIANILVDQPNNEEAIRQINDLRQNLTFGNYIAPDVAAILSQDNEMSAIQKSLIERVIAADRILQAKVSESSEGITATVGYFVDAALSSLVQSPLGGLAEVTGIGDETFEGAGQLIELAQETANLLFQDVSAEEFERRFTEVLDRVADAGLFSQSNPMFVADFIALVQEYGVGNEARWQRAMQVLDIVEPTLYLDIARGSYRGIGAALAMPTTISKIGSSFKAKDLLVTAVEGGARQELSAANTAVAAMSPARIDRGYFSGPELATMRELEVNNAALAFIKESNWGSMVDPVIVEARRQEFITETREALAGYPRHELNYDIYTDPMSNLVGVGYFGTRNGTPYLARKGAEDFAAKVGGEVVEQLHEGKTKYVVKREYLIPTEGLADETNVADLASSVLASILSTTARTTKDLDAMIKRGESQSVRVMKELGNSYSKVRRKVKRQEIVNVDTLFRQLRDDPSENWRREPLTRDEFEVLYYRKYQVEPRPEVVDYFVALRDLSDVDYFINADALLKQAANEREVMVELDGAWYRARPAKQLDADDPVFIVGDSSLSKYSDLDPERAVIYELKDAAYSPGSVGNVLYVVNDTFKTRRLHHTDVLGYNVGGHRKYMEPWEFYIKQDDRKIKLAGGKEVNSKPLTFMAVRTEAEAVAVKTQFNNIVAAIKEGFSDTKLTRVVRENNAWNTSIENIDQFRRFTEERGLDPTKEINFGGDAEPLRGAFAGENTLGDSFYSGLNASKRRGSRPLLGFGGDELESLDPSAAIQRGFTQTVSKRGEMNYLFNAVTGWLKAAEKAGVITNQADLIGMSPVSKLRNAKLSKVGETAQALLNDKNTILYRMSAATPTQQMESRAMRRMANFVYGKGSKKIAKAIDWAVDKDPIGFLRWVAFTAKLGMFAVEQVWVQSSQLLNAVAITSRNLGVAEATRGMLGVTPLAISLIKGIPDSALNHIAKTQAPFTGISPDEFLALRRWIEQTGRNVVNRTAIEENNPAGALTGNKFFEYGQVFFNMGETFARLGAASMNFKEWRKAYPNAPVEDIFSDAVTNRMIHRQDVLTASMTAASAAPWQRSALALPFQFTTFHVRMMEQIFGNRILDSQERVRAALGQVILYGAAGVPAAGFVMDRMGYQEQLDVNDPLYKVVRYGALDAVVSGLTKEETVLASRLAVGEGLFDLLTDLKNEAIWEVAVGPGGTITYDFTTAMASMMKNIFRGEFDYVSYDWKRFARNITSYDRAYSLQQALPLRYSNLS
jgi:hypothetical protein